MIAGCAPMPPSYDAGTGTCESAAISLASIGGCGIAELCRPGDCDSFMDRCEALERDVPGLLDLECLSAASSCADAERCE
jgi:hypothetical protein